ncbi:hypothetical protein ARMSODRAFT_990587 [Armillaria solidipes]|uniref:CxC2-like cysteine cluster KDZ transposase-associated domain-containing protein n=1 Tax=Armillaria solidipes TaxID=1076256 RepID=A0A2H3BAX0_9AGAR|nr:hypothetical protein ARMSODRAFT_990587 [Armillaria solidipes]
MAQWRGDEEREGHREEYLREILRGEGRGGFKTEKCASCASVDVEGPTEEDRSARYRCEDCEGGSIECRACLVQSHRRLPFHRVQVWNGRFFEKTDLRTAGLRMQLGHTDLKCISPIAGLEDFTVLHTNGIHKLLRSEWFPATMLFPQTCASFRVLEHFHALTLAGKVSAYEYYRGLTHLTDNTEVDLPVTRYRSFLRMVRQYRDIKMLKRAGRGHVEDGIATMPLGGLALLCPACPRSGVNLPDGWQDAPASEAFLYRPFVAVDANFRLKALSKSSDAKDPGLHTGLAYFVEHEAYLEHVAKYATQKEISSCSGFKTLAHAETKNNKGLRATGVVMAICARHEMVLPTAAGDLQIGERYCNVDYVAASAAKNFDDAKSLFWSYDIACQWKSRLRERMAQLPERLQLRDDMAFEFGAHKYSCQCQFSMNLKVGAARTDGEGIERVWSEQNGSSSSTKEMGPGSRHDTLDDQLGAHNWQKVVGLVYFGAAWWR